MESEARIVDVIQTHGKIHVYSTVDYGDGESHRSEPTPYPSFETAEQQLGNEIKDSSVKQDIYRNLKKVEAAAFGLIVLKDLITTQMSNRADTDLIPIISVAGIFVFTNIVDAFNSNRLVSSRQEYAAVVEAKDKNLVQYERVFPLYDEE